MKHKLLRKNRFLGLIFFVIVMVAAIMAFAATRKVTLTTYYPAPYGKYNDLQSKTLTVSDKVGIGTTAPGVQLHMVNSASVGTHVKMENTDTGGRVWNILSSGTANWGGAGNLHIYDELAPVTRLFIQGGTGNIGIGTVSPQTKLHVDTTGTNGMMLSTGTAGRPAIGNQDFLIFNGVGGSTPATMELNRTGSEVSLKLWAELDDVAAGIIGLPNRRFHLRYNNTNVLTVNNGNVGIGTVSPVARLTVAGNDGDANGALRIQNNTDGYGRSIYTCGSFGLCFNDGDEAAYLSKDGQWLATSDRSSKKDIKDMSRYGLDTVMLLKPQEYRMKNSGNRQIGFVAQEVARIIPELVRGKEGKMGLSYGQLTAVLTKAIQELKSEKDKQTEELKEEDQSLREKVVELEARLKTIEEKLNIKK